MACFLLEIGTEELPADFARLVLPQLAEKVFADFERLRLKHGKIQCFSTPRRVVLFVEDLSDLAEDIIEERKGPPANKAFVKNTPTKAAIGFAKRCGVGLDDLHVLDTEKGPFVFARMLDKGKSVYDLLIDLIPLWIGNIQGRRFMRWGKGDRRFSRPVRWIVSLIDEKVVPVHLNDCDPEIFSGNISRGHRLHKEYLEINSASKYFEILKNYGVIVDREKRKCEIKNLVRESSQDLKSYPDFPNLLLEELTDLVELPSLICGSFEDSFLDLPPEVLTTVMRVHQRYIPLYCVEGELLDPLLLHSHKTLLPSFLCISNGLLEASNKIKKGNERVLKARLSDARFFVSSDLSISSRTRLELLKNVSFSEGLGSLYDRVQRIKWLVDILIQKTHGPKINLENTKRAAIFCKHDLVSQMVGEFPELEGIMGGKYLLKEGEPRDVALAVLEHYHPRGSNDSIPSSDSGCILALAERFELLLSIFSKGERPSGSSDPYALRRAGNGILQILFTKNWKFNLEEFLTESIIYWHEMFPDFNIDKTKLLNDLSDFFRQRIISFLEEKELDFDLVQAIAGETIPISRLLSDPIDIKIRVNLLSEMRTNGTLPSLQSVVTRASRLAEKNSMSYDVYGTSNVINPDLFEKSSEAALFNLINSLEAVIKCNSTNRYSELAKILVEGAKLLSDFFDGDKGVMVMVENIELRNNRLNLLSIIRNQSTILADFNKIQS